MGETGVWERRVGGWLTQSIGLISGVGRYSRQMSLCVRRSSRQAEMSVQVPPARRCVLSLAEEHVASWLDRWLWYYGI